MIPTMILVMLAFGGFMLDVAKHGEPKKGEYNAGIGLIAFLVIMALYYWAGLLDPFLK